MFEALGLDAATETLYRLMLTQPTWNVEELADAAGQPVDVVRRCLDKLAELALLGESAEHPGRLRSVSPDVGLQRLWQRKEAELVARQRAVAETYVDVSKVVSQYINEYSRPRLGEVEILDGLDAIRDRLAATSMWATTSIEALVPSGQQPPEAIQAAQTNDLDVLARGVEMRSVYLTSARNDPATRRHLNWLAEHGAHLRLTPSIPLRMVLVDRNQAIVPIDATDSARGAFVLSGGGVMTALGLLFDKIWEDSELIGEESASCPEGITAQERELLKLLAEGCTDEVAARQLGLSLRTVRRMVSVLMGRLGARSRFEAGMRLAESGWL
jgi:DNA-binding CsgD family transcriptional regulator